MTVPNDNQYPLINPRQFSSVNPKQFPLERFRTTHPQGKNSVYERLPDGRWLREKTATGETHVQDHTMFVHPDYANGVHWAHMNGPEDLFKGGTINHITINNEVPKGHPDRQRVNPVPSTHLSGEPIEGWTPVEWSTKEDSQGNRKLASRHLGHPVAPVQHGDWGAHDAGRGRRVAEMIKNGEQIRPA